MGSTLRPVFSGQLYHDDGDFLMSYLLLAAVAAVTEYDHSSVSWRDLSLTAGSKTLVQAHSGSALSGRLTGVLGPSGAGKTSLLNALAGVLPASTSCRGAIWQPTGDGWRRVGVADGTAALLEQDDAFFPELTVCETLTFSARLEGIPAREAEAEAQALLMHVGLEGVSHRRVGERRIGTGAAGISGGERRRLAVACAIAGEGSASNAPPPRVLLADEPTTGLDAFQAERVVNLLRSLAVSRRCAAVATLHQPRGSIWHVSPHSHRLAHPPSAIRHPIPHRHRHRLERTI